MICFHKWEDVYIKISKTFLGEVCTENQKTKYRKCKKCNKVQFFKRVGFTTGYHNDLLDCEQKIFLKKLKRIDNLLILDTQEPKPPKRI